MAGEDVIGPFLADRGNFLAEVVKPLQDKEEPLYVVHGSDAEAYAVKRFPHKRARRVGSGRRVRREELCLRRKQIGTSLDGGVGAIGTGRR